nr:hypothetical protein [uncultured Psychroserpens sp.]
MELLELKSIWNIVTEEAIKNHMINEYEVKTTIQKDSKTTLSKIKRVMKLKLFIGSLVGVLTLLFSIVSIVKPNEIAFFDFAFSPKEYALFFIIMFVGMLFMVIHNLKAYKVLLEFEKSSEDLKNALTKIIKVMENAMKLNIYSDAFITPIVVTWITYAKVFSEREMTFKLGIIVLVVIPLLIFCFSYFFQRFAQKLKFGNYVNQLKSYLKSLEEEKNY